VTDAGIAIKAKILRGVLPEIDRAWALIKAGLVRGLSIGFRSIEDSDIKGTWGRRFTKWEWLELSAVTIPRQQRSHDPNHQEHRRGTAALDRARSAGAAERRGAHQVVRRFGHPATQARSNKHEPERADRGV
jgi:phage head maturation protease